MYCGDETGAFVGDVGHTSSRFGYGGEDCPKYVVPSWVRGGGGGGGAPPSSSGPSSLLRSPPDLGADADARPVFSQSRLGSTNPDDYLNSDGLIEDYDAWERLWSGAFSTLRVWDGRKHTTGGRRVDPSKVGAGGEDGAAVEERVAHPLLAVDSGIACPGGYDFAGGGGESDGSPAAARAGDKRKADGGDFSPKRIDATALEAAVRRQRAKMVEILFEKFAAPAVFVAPSPMLSAFAHGRRTGLVVDVGGAGTRVTPVVDGLLLGNAQRRSGRGGEWLGAVQCRALRERCGLGEVHPRYAFRAGRGRAAGSPSGSDGDGGMAGRKKAARYPSEMAKSTNFHRLAVAEVMYEMKTAGHVRLQKWREDTSVPFVSEAGDSGENSDDKMDVDDGDEGGEDDSGSGDVTTSDDDSDSDGGDSVYELPDGTRVDVSAKSARRRRRRRRRKRGGGGGSSPTGDLRRLPELLFTDSVPFHDLPPSPDPSTRRDLRPATRWTLSSLPVHELCRASLTSVGESDARKELCGNVLLCGASSLYPHFPERLSYELGEAFPGSYKCRVVASRNAVERRYGAWIGGSILTSLGSFQQLWLSRAEYEEWGATVGTQRFP